MNAPALVAALLLVPLATGVPAPLLRVGDTLPRVQGTTLAGRQVTLPAASRGQTTLLLLGFTYDSRHAVERWAGWFRDAMRSRSDVALYEMPMLGGMARLGGWFIERGMRRHTPADLHDRVITVYRGVDDWKRHLGVSRANEHDAFLIVAGPDGVVRWLHHGPLDVAAAGDLERTLAMAPAQ